MWWKLAVGGAAGLLIGSAVPPGYWLWVVVGMVGGYVVDVWQRLRRSAASGEKPPADGA